MDYKLVSLVFTATIVWCSNSGSFLSVVLSESCEEEPLKLYVWLAFKSLEKADLELAPNPQYHFTSFFGHIYKIDTISHLDKIALSKYIDVVCYHKIANPGYTNKELSREFHPLTFLGHPQFTWFSCESMNLPTRDDTLPLIPSLGMQKKKKKRIKNLWFY